MRKTITFFKRSIFAVALMIFSVNAWSQMPSNGGFENGKPTGHQLAILVQ